MTKLEEKIRNLELFNSPSAPDFDPCKEFGVVKKLFELYKTDTKKSDIAHLYTSAFYTNDQAMLLQFKVKLF